jgi:hypothetical protein
MTYIGEGFVAAFMVAHVRLLACMSSGVDCQSTALDKALVAVRYRAVVRTFIGMDPIVSTQI